jgi:hypothetical protein
MGPLLGIKGPEEHVSFPVSFSHRSVGSSILASLSEAGGNDLQKPVSKPLPPRSPFLAGRHMRRAHSSQHSTPPTTVEVPCNSSNSLLLFILTPDPVRKGCSDLASSFSSELCQAPFPIQSRPRPILFAAMVGSKTPVTKFSGIPDYRFFGAFPRKLTPWGSLQAPASRSAGSCAHSSWPWRFFYSQLPSRQILRSLSFRVIQRAAAAAVPRRPAQAIARSFVIRPRMLPAGGRSLASSPTISSFPNTATSARIILIARAPSMPSFKLNFLGRS